jgi:hypothetical protein
MPRARRPPTPAAARAAVTKSTTVAETAEPVTTSRKSQHAATAPAVYIYADNAEEVQMHIGSVILVIWLVIGGLAAGQRGDYKGSVNCSRAATAAVTILAGPLNYAGVNPHINCTVQHPSN